MDDLKKKLIQLSFCRNVGWKTIYTLLQNDPQLTNLHNFTQTELQQITSKTAKQTVEMLTDLHNNSITKKITSIKQSNVDVIAIYDDNYPPLLKNIYNPPWLLYVKGNSELFKLQKNLAVVGSRNITPYGKYAIETIFPALIKERFTIISGLAVGTDTEAHLKTMQLGGHTIAVIAGGFNNIYPYKNKDLATEISRDHLLISEYHPDERPQRWQFPARNRIISGLSWGTLVIEAAKRSGSFITADNALNEGREVFALPGNITSDYSVGTNNLIQKGAKLVTSATDIIEELPNYLTK